MTKNLQAKETPATKPSPRRLLRWLLLWLVLFAAGLVLYNVSYVFTRSVMINQLQVRPAAWLLRLTLPDIEIWHQGSSIFTRGLELEIRQGCDGMEVWLMLAAALLAFPMTLRRRLRSIAYGTLLVFTLNLIRIVSIFHVALKRPDWFVVAHEFAWPTAMVLAATAFVLLQFESPSCGMSSTGEVS
jgi:exosortase family protein XrtM